MTDEIKIGKVSTRPATADDLEFMLEAYRLNFRAIIEEARGWDDEIERQSLRNEMEKSPYLILLYDGEDAGFVCLEIHDAAYIKNIEVHPDFNGRGIGTLVLRWLMKKAAGKPVRVAVTEKNHKGMEFYTNLGFRPVGEITLPLRGSRGLQLLKKTLMQLN